MTKLQAPTVAHWPRTVWTSVSSCCQSSSVGPSLRRPNDNLQYPLLFLPIEPAAFFSSRLCRGHLHPSHLVSVLLDRRLSSSITVPQVWLNRSTIVVASYVTSVLRGRIFSYFSFFSILFGCFSV
ncbi:hypothetical protein PUN28_008527 [Cardiocondyla obscurior]|uniref:Uncharacterized protein n=1 Tax=Cardiocondyla obscurior TaxID=286306 RepID=A0AAW2G452_9HYME